MATAEIKDADEVIKDITKPPFLRRVRIRGYKSIAFCDVTLEPLTVLVGRNASGKSNFLDALAFLRDVMETNVTEAVKRHGGWSSILCQSVETDQVEFEIESAFVCSPQQLGPNGSAKGPNIQEFGPDFAGQRVVATYVLKIGEGNLIAPVIREERLKCCGERDPDAGGFEVYRSAEGAATTLWTYPPLQIAADTDQLRYGRLDFFTRSDHSQLAAIGFQPYGACAEGLGAMGFHNVHPGAVRGVPKTSNGSVLEKDASNLASVIRCLNEVEPSALARVKQYVCHIVEEISDFWVQAYGERETVRFRMRSQAGSKPLEFDAECMSDGTLRVLANIMAAFQNVAPYGHPSVVGIEEPETALHPAAMNALVDALDEATTQTQVIITTHSAELLDNPTIKPKNVRVVEMIGGRTVIGPVDEASIEIVQSKLDTLGGLERQDQLGIDFDDQERQQRLADNGQERHE